MIAKTDKSICFKASVYPPFTEDANQGHARVVRERGMYAALSEIACENASAFATKIYRFR